MLKKRVYHTAFMHVLSLFAFASHLVAQTPPANDTGALESRATTTEPSSKLPKATGSEFIRISPRRSKPQATPGDSFEIAVDIENISTKTLYFNPLYVTMTPPPELDPQAPRDWYGTFPGGGSNFCEGNTDKG